MPQLTYFLGGGRGRRAQDFSPQTVLWGLLSYGGVCCLITVTVTLPVNKPLYSTAVSSLLVTNTEVLLTPKFPLRHNSLFLHPSFPFCPAGFFSVPQFQREAENKLSWKLSLHPPFWSPCFLPLYITGSIWSVCPLASTLWKIWIRLWLGGGCPPAHPQVYQSCHRPSCISKGTLKGVWGTAGCPRQT